MPIKEFWNDINSERKHRRAPPWSTTSCCDTPQTSTCCGCSSPSAPSGRDTLLKMIYLRMPWNILRTSPGYFVFSLVAQFQDSFRCVVDDKRICWWYIFQCSTISRYLLYHSEREFLSSLCPSLLSKTYRRSPCTWTQVLQENMRLTAFFKLYKICILLHRCNLNILAKNRFEKSAISVKIQQHFCKCCKICKKIAKF